MSNPATTMPPLTPVASALPRLLAGIVSSDTACGLEEHLVRWGAPPVHAAAVADGEGVDVAQRVLVPAVVRKAATCTSPKKAATPRSGCSRVTAHTSTHRTAAG